MTGRTIPVTRTDDSEVAGEATQELIKAKTDNLDIALSALRDALRGSGSKTNTDIVTELASIGGASAAAAGDTGESTTNGFLRWLRDKFKAFTGQQTSANSLSVTGASDGVFYVGGVSADGVAPTNQAVRVGGIDAGGLKRTLLTDTSGNQYVRQLAAVSTNISLVNPSDAATLAVPDGYNSWTVKFDAASVTGSMTFRFSIDGGTNWNTLYMNVQNNSSQAAPTASISPTIPFTFEGPIPNGATHVQVFATSLSSGTVTGKITASPRVCSPLNQLTAYLSTSVQRIGFSNVPKIRYADTTAALTTGSPSFTGTGRDAWAAAAGSVTQSLSEFGKTVTAVAFADQPFDLYIEVSEDNSTYNRWHKASATAVGSVYGATLQISPSLRYWRIYAVKTGSDTTYFRCYSKMEAA